MRAKILSLFLASLMMLTLVSCGDSNTEPVPPAVQDYVNTLNSGLSEIENNSISIKAEARGNDVVYKYTFKEVSSKDSADTSSVKAYVESIRAELESALFDAHGTCTEIETVIHEFYGKDEVLICTVVSDDPNVLPSTSSVGDGITLSQYADSMNKVGGIDNDTFALTFEARQNVLVYKFTLKGRDSITDAQKNAFLELASSMKGEIDATFADLKTQFDGLEALIYEYYESDGDLICSEKSGS